MCHLSNRHLNCLLESASVILHRLRVRVPCFGRGDAASLSHSGGSSWALYCQLELIVLSQRPGHGLSPSLPCGGLSLAEWPGDSDGARSDSELRLPGRCHPSGFTGPAGNLKAVMGTDALTIMTQAISWQSYFRLGVITSSTHARTSIASLSPVDGGALVVWLGCCSRTVVVI